MQSQYPPRETMRQRLERDRRAIDALLADPDVDELVWERLPNGEFAWLRPEPCYVLADKGRAAIAYLTALALERNAVEPRSETNF